MDLGRGGAVWGGRLVLFKRIQHRQRNGPGQGQGGDDSFGTGGMQRGWLGDGFLVVVRIVGVCMNPMLERIQNVRAKMCTGFTDIGGKQPAPVVVLGGG